MDGRTVNPELVEFINSYYIPGGLTYLTKAIHQATEASADFNTHSINLVFTDGVENLGDNAEQYIHHERKRLKSEIDKILQAYHKKPAVLCVGAGDVDQALLEVIAESTGCEFINCQDPSNFSQVLDRVKAYITPHKMLYIINKNMNNKSSQVVVKDGELTVSPLPIQLYDTGSFSISGHQPHLVPNSLATLPRRSSLFNGSGQANHSAKKKSPAFLT